MGYFGLMLFWFYWFNVVLVLLVCFGYIGLMLFWFYRKYFVLFGGFKTISLVESSFFLGEPNVVRLELEVQTGEIFSGVTGSIGWLGRLTLRCFKFLALLKVIFFLFLVLLKGLLVCFYYLF